MAKIYGYGEDSLTYWAIKNNKLFEELQLRYEKDKTNTLEWLTFYRPSFGRGKFGYGEFDAIVATKDKIYLIESKWDIGKKGKTIKLKPQQILRHIIFEWYFGNSISKNNFNEKEFNKCVNVFIGKINNTQDFNKEDIKKVCNTKKTIVPVNSHLEYSLKFVIDKLYEHIQDKNNYQLKNILCIFGQGDLESYKLKDYSSYMNNSFSKIGIKYDDASNDDNIKNSGFVIL